MRTYERRVNGGRQTEVVRVRRGYYEITLTKTGRYRTTVWSKVAHSMPEARKIARKWLVTF